MSCKFFFIGGYDVLVKRNCFKQVFSNVVGKVWVGEVFCSPVITSQLCVRVFVNTDFFFRKNINFPSILQIRELKPGEMK